MLTPEQIERMNKNREQALERRKRKINSHLTEKNEKIAQEVKSTSILPAAKNLKTVNLCLENSDRFKARCSFDLGIISIFKLMPTKIYDKKDKSWSFDISDYFNLLASLKKNPILLIEEISPYIINTFLQDRKKSVAIQTDFNIEIDEKIKKALYPYQVDCLKKAIQNEGRLLIADEMGLGKTLQALAIASYYRSEWPFLIVCTASLKLSWLKSVNDWFSTIKTHDVTVISTVEILPQKLIYIISYNMLNRVYKTIKNMNFKIIIADESHNIKNYKSIKTKSFLSIAKKSKRLLLLSGTPLLSRPLELYGQINLISPTLFNNFHNYGLRYCNAKQTQFGFNYNGSSNLSELKAILEHKIMIRRLKTDVLVHLPKKTRRIAFLNESEIDNKLIKAKTDINSPGDNSQGILQYYNDSAMAKAGAVSSFIIKAALKIHKLIVFAHHQSVLDSVVEALKINKIAHVKIDGSLSSNKRFEFCTKFQNDFHCRVAVLSINACCAGLDLTVCQTVIFAELTWNPGILMQAEDRVHRIGQQKDVNIIYLIAKGTIDDQIWQTIDKKLNIVFDAGINMSNFDNILKN